MINLSYIAQNIQVNHHYHGNRLKKMKDYINLFHSMVSEIHFWDKLTKIEKSKKFSMFLSDFNNIEYLLDYFEEFNTNLSKKTLNSYLKSVSNP